MNVPSRAKKGQGRGLTSRIRAGCREVESRGTQNGCNSNAVIVSNVF